MQKTFFASDNAKIQFVAKTNTEVYHQNDLFVLLKVLIHFFLLLFLPQFYSLTIYMLLDYLEFYS